MNSKQQWTGRVNSDGSLAIPPELAAKFGLRPGVQIVYEESPNEFHVLRPASHLAKIYVEPTDLCNLECRTCARNVWEEPMGMMSQATFERLLASIQQIDPLPTVFFGGYGEPLAHPKTIEMIRQVKATGARVELITNGILLNEKRLFGLIEAGLDLLWISLDGASAEGYADIRLGGSFERVVQNLRRLPEIRMRAGFQHDHRPQLGIAFVAMKRNITDLPALFRLGAELGVRHYSISNVLAHTPELNEEVLYSHSLHNHTTLFNTSRSIVNVPRIDMNSLTQQPLTDVLSRKDMFLTAGKESQRAVDACQFIEQGSTAVRWDGAVCPCIPLLHTSEHYLDHRLRTTHSHVFGMLEEKDLLEIWNAPDYLALRERLQSFDFSPCTFCNGCNLSLDNQEDCMASPPPTCGGCLWAQGFIQCP